MSGYPKRSWTRSLTEHAWPQLINLSRITGILLLTI
nr:MAG TPA: hypothetical protein [Caudoviricetes sp.]